ncbi:transposase [Streptomyces umbrinus]|uniref:transposase n=1 Tax=Streptomyces umbrinus TaxID=67370 RepID=UPI003C2F98F2
MVVDPSQRLVPDGLWKLFARLLPSFNSRPQGGGTAPCDERAGFTAVVHVLTSGCAWRHLPETFGVSPATAHRRFTAWTRAGLWRRLHRAVLDELGARGELDWASAIVDPASVRAKGGTLTGPNPVDRGVRSHRCCGGRMPLTCVPQVYCDGFWTLFGPFDLWSCRLGEACCSCGEIAYCGGAGGVRRKVIMAVARGMLPPRRP